MSDIRNLLRTEIINSPKMKPTSRLIEFMGAQIEVRTPTLRTILDQPSDSDEENVKRVSMIRAIIVNTYVPHTDELLFEEGDIDMFMNMAYNTDVQHLFEVMSELMTPNSKGQAVS